MKEIFDSSLCEDASVLAGNRSLNKDYALYIEGLTVSFDGFKAVDNLSLYVDEGEIRVIIGPNGAGKTTVLDMICGKTKATSGSIKFHDKELTKLKEKELACYKEIEDAEIEVERISKELKEYHKNIV